jgi:hypothetical protein
MAAPYDVRINLPEHSCQPIDCKSSNLGPFLRFGL